MDAIFFPRNDYPSKVEICAHRLGKSMTYSDSTDSINRQVVYDWFMGLAKARNIKMGAFLTYSDFQNFPFILDDYRSGKIWFDIYSQTPAPELLLDEETATEENYDNYYHSVWKPSFLSGIGLPPTAISYRIGLTYFEDYVPKYFLAGRNSAVNNNTDYGVGYGNPNNIPYDKDTFKSKRNTLRWYDAIEHTGEIEQELQIVSDLIDATKANGGWIRNFMHWHNPYDAGHQDWVVRYLDLLASKNSDNSIYFAGFGEALAYLAFRQIITKVVMYSPLHHQTTQLIVRLETNNNLGINSDLLQVPISVKFSTIGTPLEGQAIKCKGRNLIGLGNNQYIVEIPYERFPYAMIETI